MILPRIVSHGYEYWLRLASLFHLYNERLYRHILHVSCKLPKDPQLLHKELSKKKHHFKHLRKFNKLSEEQYDTVFPRDEKTDISKFDVTTFVVVVQFCTKLKPRGGWVLVRQLNGTDKSKGAFLLELEHFYKENLEEVEPILEHRFEDDWEELIYIFKGLKFNTAEVDDLKACEITSTCLPHKYIESIMKAQLEFVRSTQRLNAGKIRQLQCDDEHGEIEGDVEALMERSAELEKSIDGLYEVICQGDAWRELFIRLAHVDESLMEVSAKIDFLQDLMNLEHAAPSSSPTEDVEDEDANEEVNNNEIDEEKEENELDTTDNASVDSSKKVTFAQVHTTASVKTRLCQATKKLRTFYAYTFNQNEMLKDHGCCRQSYTDMELMRRRPDKWVQTSRSIRGSLKAALPVEERLDELDELFDYNRHVLLRGIAGIGKTYLIREVVSKWVHGCLFHDISFLFVFNYSDAKQNSECTSLEQLLKRVYPQVLSSVSIDELMSNPERLLIIFDGWGKLERLDYVQIEESNGRYNYQPNLFGRILFDALNSDTGQFKDSYTITTSRPEYFDALRDGLSTHDVSEIDVIGFSDQSYNNFIFDVFSGNKEFLATIKERVAKQRGFKNLLKIPLNVSMYCMIQLYNEDLEKLRTETELHLWKLALILHEKSIEAELDNEKGYDLEVFNSSIALTSIMEAAQLSYQSQMGGVDHSDSFFVDHNMQEFLSSVYACCVLRMTPLEVNSDHRLRNCLPFVAGMQGLACRTSVKYTCLVQSFVKNLECTHKNGAMNELFTSYLNEYDSSDEVVLDNNFLPFLEAYYEYQNPLLPDDSLTDCFLHFKLHELLPRDVNNLAHFFTHEREQLTICSMELHTHQTIDRELMLRLCPTLLTVPIVKLDVKSIDGSSSEFFEVIKTFKKNRITLTDFHVFQKCSYSNNFSVDFGWIVYMNAVNIHLTTNRNNDLLQSLKSAITHALNNKMPIRLTTFKLTIATSDHEILNTLLELLENFLFVKEIHLHITEQAYVSSKEPYRNHRQLERVDITEISSITQTLYKGMKANGFAKNLQRLYVKDKHCGYEFVVNKQGKHIVFSSDEKRKSMVDVDFVNL